MQLNKQEIQLLLKNVDSIAYVRRPASDFQLQREIDYSLMSAVPQMLSLLSNVTINASITDIMCGHLAKHYIVLIKTRKAVVARTPPPRACQIVL